MSANWKLVTSAHVREACRRFNAGEVKCSHPARNTFLILDGKRYPAKFIRGLAYEVATGVKLNPSVDFSGGAETARFFRKLGFRIKHPTGAVRDRAGSRQRARVPSPIDIHRPINRAKLGEKQQKEALKKVLEREFGAVELNRGFDWLVVPQEVSMDEAVARICRKLMRYRHFSEFYTSGRKLLCDFYMPSCRLIIEYDERQHFTEPRALCLEEYPGDLLLGFARKKWLEACRTIRARDDEPPYRDEQRAFYDALRDLLAVRNGFTLVRIKHGDWDWNEPRSGEHVRELIQKSTGNVTESREGVWQIELRRDPKPRLGRVIIASTWPGDVPTARRLLEEVCLAWPRDLKVDCLVTCGAFLRFDWPSLATVHDYLRPEPAAVDALLTEAQRACDSLLNHELVDRLAQRARYLTIGVDSPLQNKITITRNRITVPHVELVCVVDLHARPPRFYWTGKSYPTCGQADRLVRIEDLKTHFLNFKIGKVMVLGCHDLTMFHPRAWATAKGWRKATQNQFQVMAKRECPAIVLHHPHTTVKRQTWLTAWNQLRGNLPSVTAFVGAGRYQEDDRAEEKWDDLNAVLNSTRFGPTVDVICHSLSKP
jgi:very-short-patch-repair endonuclease